MQYRKMKKAAPDLSILGFGCMRLPLKESGQIDEEKATGMIRYAIDHGVNYIDTAYPYHNGESEPVVGRALAGGYREKVHLATKLPSWLVQSREDMDKYLSMNSSPGSKPTTSIFISCTGSRSRSGRTSRLSASRTFWTMPSRTSGSAMPGSHSMTTRNSSGRS